MGEAKRHCILRLNLGVKRETLAYLIFKGKMLWEEKLRKKIRLASYHQSPDKFFIQTEMRRMMMRRMMKVKMIEIYSVLLIHNYKTHTSLLK